MFNNCYNNSACSKGNAGECCIQIPGTNITLSPGCRIRLSKFETTVWIVNMGWYSWGQNRETCGWYLYVLDNPDIIKPLNRNDLDDIYIVER